MRLAILTDIHEDYENLLKVIGKAESGGFDKLICLGDISGFSLPHYTYGDSRNAAACLSLLRKKCDIIIPGNHDLHAAGIRPELPEVMKDKEIWPHEQDMDPGYKKEDLQFIGSLPFYRTLDSPVGKILFSHYVYPNLSGFVKGFYHGEKEFHEHFLFMQERECSLCFTGHAHPMGFYRVHPRGYRHYRRRVKKITTFPAIIGVPSTTRHERRSSFCIFDTNSLRLQVLT